MLIALLIVLAAVVVFVLLKNRSTEAPQASPSAPSATEAATADASEAPATAAPVVVSEECGNAFLFAEAHQGEPETSSLQQRTLDLCSTRAEWIAAAKLHPGAVGLSDSALVDENLINQLCGDTAERALCRG